MNRSLIRSRDLSYMLHAAEIKSKKVGFSTATTNESKMALLFWSNNLVQSRLSGWIFSNGNADGDFILCPFEPLPGLPLQACEGSLSGLIETGSAADARGRVCSHRPPTDTLCAWRSTPTLPSRLPHAAGVWRQGREWHARRRHTSGNMCDGDYQEDYSGKGRAAGKAPLGDTTKHEAIFHRLYSICENTNYVTAILSQEQKIAI